MSRATWFTRPIYWLLILALVLSLALAVPVGSRVNADPSEVWVDDDNCPGPGSGTQADPYCSIQDGIDNVDPGGTVHVAAGTYTESNITINNKAVQVLGAGADVTIIDGGGSGPVVTADDVGSDTKLDGFTITNGKASWGGGMCIGNSASPVISNCRFVGNSADYTGGGMYNTYSSPTVTDCTFEGNSANVSGGGMANDSSSPTVPNCNFSGNSATISGGGMYNCLSSPIVTSCDFNSNSVGNYGGGMYNTMSSPNVTECIFSDNSVTSSPNSYGGGMYNHQGSSPAVTNCFFSGNSANLGGGITNYQSSPAVTNCVFYDNSATYHGGGMFNWDNSSPTVTNCVFHDNSATYYGGGMYNNGSCSPDVTNCIVTGNNATNSGGGIYWDDCSLADPDYNDFWDNSPDDYGDCLAGSNDISQDPMFANPSAEDFHLMSGSPCIDAGTNDGAPGEDKDGEPRPIDGDWDGTATADMGAYEYIPVLPVEFSATPTTGPIPLEVQFSDETPGDFSSWSWDFGDGGTSNEQNPTHTYNQTGPFTVSLSISSLSGRGTETKVNYIHPYSQGVGGEAYPVNRLAILAPWFGLVALLLGGTSWLVLKRRRAES